MPRAVLAKPFFASGNPSERAQAMLAGLRAAGLKVTPQRMAIVREVAGDESHPSAQELFERLRRMLPTMSFATVYNTLSALCDAGLGGQLALAPGSTRFDPNTQPHDHVVCDACGAVRDVPPPSSEAASSGDGGRALASAAPGFSLRAVERIFRGLCVHCRGAGRSTGKAAATGRNHRESI
jgi:Fe2+ or Zn2+ uptake regulation protein